MEAWAQGSFRRQRRRQAKVQQKAHSCKLERNLNGKSSSETRLNCVELKCRKSSDVGLAGDRRVERVFSDYLHSTEAPPYLCKLKQLRILYLRRPCACSSSERMRAVQMLSDPLKTLTEHFHRRSPIDCVTKYAAILGQDRREFMYCFEAWILQ